MTRRAGPWSKVPRSLWTDERAIGLSADALWARVSIHAWASVDAERGPEGAGWLVTEEGAAWSTAKLAALLRRPEAATARAVDELIAARILGRDESTGALLILGWVESTEASSTRRMRQLRERAKSPERHSDARGDGESITSPPLLLSSSPEKPAKPARARDDGGAAPRIVDEINRRRAEVGLRPIRDCPGTRRHVASGTARLRRAAGGRRVEVEVAGELEVLDLDTDEGEVRAWEIVARRKSAEVASRGAESDAAKYFTPESLARHCDAWVLQRGAWDAPPTVASGPPSAGDWDDGVADLFRRST